MRMMMSGTDVGRRLQWCSNLKQHISIVENISNIESDVVQILLHKYDVISKYRKLSWAISSYENQIYREWRDNYIEQIKESLKATLFIRDRGTDRYHINIDKRVFYVGNEYIMFKKTNNDEILLQLDGKDDDLLSIMKKRSTLVITTDYLNDTIRLYESINDIMTRSPDGLLALFQSGISSAEECIFLRGMTTLSWNSISIETFAKESHNTLYQLHSKIYKCAVLLDDIHNGPLRDIEFQEYPSIFKETFHNTDKFKETFVHSFHVCRLFVRKKIQEIIQYLKHVLDVMSEVHDTSCLTFKAKPHDSQQILEGFYYDLVVDAIVKNTASSFKHIADWLKDDIDNQVQVIDDPMFQNVGRQNYLFSLRLLLYPGFTKVVPSLSEIEVVMMECLVRWSKCYDFMDFWDTRDKINVEQKMKQNLVSIQSLWKKFIQNSHREIIHAHSQIIMQDLSCVWNYTDHNRKPRIEPDHITNGVPCFVKPFSFGPICVNTNYLNIQLHQIYGRDRENHKDNDVKLIYNDYHNKRNN